MCIDVVLRFLRIQWNGHYASFNTEQILIMETSPDLVVTNLCEIRGITGKKDIVKSASQNTIDKHVVIETRLDGLVKSRSVEVYLEQSYKGQGKGHRDRSNTQPSRLPSNTGHVNWTLVNEVTRTCSGDELKVWGNEGRTRRKWSFSIKRKKGNRPISVST